MLRCLLLVVVFAGGPTPAHACRFNWAGTIFFDKITPDFYPGSDFRADVVADVVLEDVRNDGGHAIVNARVRNAIKGEIKAGELIQILYLCGPFPPPPDKGEDGLIAAKYSDFGEGQKILLGLRPPRAR